jgi:hypothetical protein
MQIDFMCAVVEDYIYRMKGVQVRIDRKAVASDGRQMAMLMHAYQIASNGDKEHSNI